MALFMHMFYNANRDRKQKAEQPESFGYIELDPNAKKRESKQIILTEPDIADMIKRHTKIQSKRKKQ